MALRENEAQEKAIQTIHGPVLLVSCPGSGKTTTLVRRIHRMLEEGIPADSVLMVTFSKAAAIEMKQKYLRMYGKNPGVAFQTIHSLCLNLLVCEGKYAREDILPERDKFDFLFTQSRELGDAAGDPWELAQQIATEIGVIKNNYITMKGYVPKSCDKLSFLSIFKSYEKWKERNHTIDFDDMLIKCKEMLEEEPAVREKWGSRFRYIQCDEYQDTNYIQRDILRLLSGSGGNLCAVGDDDQSIYRFRGARPEIMRGFTDDFEGAEVIRMGTNYRCAGTIVKHADALIRHNRERFEKEFVSQRGEDGTAGSVEYVRTDGKAAQTERLLAEIRKAHAEGTPYRNMAVLFRTNREIAPVLTAAAREGIPYYAMDNVRCIYDGWIFRDIRTYIDLSSGKWKDGADLRRKILAVLNRPNRYFDPEDFRGREYTLRDFREAIYPLHKEEGWKYNAALAKIDNWMNAFGPGRITPDSTTGAMEKALTGPRGVHYEKYLKEAAKFRNTDPEDYLSELEELLTEARRFETVGKWLACADRTSRQIREKQKAGSEEGVALATMHKAKGLEWDTVFIADCYDGSIPHRHSTGEEEREEERRLFYVAMTRAKDRLVVLNPGRAESPFAKEAGLMTAEEIRKAQAVPKYLPGKPVIHNKFGKGAIVSYSPGSVYVRFESGTKRLAFPKAFLDGFIKYV